MTATRSPVDGAGGKLQLSSHIPEIKFKINESVKQPMCDR